MIERKKVRYPSRLPSARTTKTAEAFRRTDDESIVTQAIAILDKRLRKPGAFFQSPADTKRFLRLQLEQEESEVFGVLFLDNRHRLIEFEPLFRGTIDGAAVYPREVVKIALSHNCAACILTHNHPSGIPEPSSADISLTKRLKEALAIIDVRVLDHIVVGANATVSFAERGLL